MRIEFEWNPDWWRVAHFRDRSDHGKGPECYQFGPLLLLIRHPRKAKP